MRDSIHVFEFRYSAVIDAASRHARRLAIPLVCVLVVMGGIFLATVQESKAVPAFARKYTVNCTVCHTRPPRLNTYGERFLENGYQLPGTEDGGIVGKKRLGDLTLDDVTNYLAFRIRGNAVRNFDFARQSPGPGVAGNPEDRTEFGFPQTFNLFTAGTITQNVGFFVEVESNLEKGETNPERGFFTLNNLGSHNLAHLRIGRLDPSAFWPYPTHRQQLDPVRADFVDNGVFVAPTINRIPLVPNAFAAKFFGLFDRKGKTILPFQPSLFNSTNEMGIDVHGRPFGRWFLYQVGILNGAGEDFGDSNNPKDWFVMGRLDYAESGLFSANIAGFAYFGNNNAKVVKNQADVSWNRYGIAATVRYRMVDIYGAYIIDRVTDLPKAIQQNFDATATGVTVEADVLVTDRILLSARYDHLDAGGVLSLRKSNSILAFQGKYYLRTNIALFLRDDVNLREAQAGNSAPRNFRNAFLVGADLIF